MASLVGEKRCATRSARAAVALVTLVVGLAACTPTNRDPEGSRTDSASRAGVSSTTQPSTSSPIPTDTALASTGLSLSDAARSDALSAYLDMWVDFATAGHTSDWQAPALSAHATAYALQVMQKSLYTDQQNGVITKGAPVDHPSVKSASPASDPTVVLISDCGDSSQTAKYVAKTGQPAPGGAGGRQSITAEVRKQPDGSWKVDQFAVDGVGSC